MTISSWNVAGPIFPVAFVWLRKERQSIEAGKESSLELLEKLRIDRSAVVEKQRYKNVKFSHPATLQLPRQLQILGSSL